VAHQATGAQPPHRRRLRCDCRSAGNRRPRATRCFSALMIDSIGAMWLSRGLAASARWAMSPAQPNNQFGSDRANASRADAHDDAFSKPRAKIHSQTRVVQCRPFGADSRQPHCSCGSKAVDRIGAAKGRFSADGGPSSGGARLSATPRRLQQRGINDPWSMGETRRRVT
jgi:hypothetical protein